MILRKRKFQPGGKSKKAILTADKNGIGTLSHMDGTEFTDKEKKYIDRSSLNAATTSNFSDYAAKLAPNLGGYTPTKKLLFENGEEYAKFVNSGADINSLEDDYILGNAYEQPGAILRSERTGYPVTMGMLRNNKEAIENVMTTNPALRSLFEYKSTTPKYQAGGILLNKKTSIQPLVDMNTQNEYAAKARDFESETGLGNMLDSQAANYDDFVRSHGRSRGYEITPKKSGASPKWDFVSTNPLAQSRYMDDGTFTDDLNNYNATKTYNDKHAVDKAYDWDLKNKFRGDAAGYYNALRKTQAGLVRRGFVAPLEGAQTEYMAGKQRVPKTRTEGFYNQFR